MPSMNQKNIVLPEQRYFNRELSWLEFNQRVLEEANNSLNPLLERVKFLAIFESNLDEFYMIRVSGILEQVQDHIEAPSPEGNSALHQLKKIRLKVKKLKNQSQNIWKDLKSLLEKQNVLLKSWDNLEESEKNRLIDYFEKEIFPLCTPLLLYPSSKPPFISGRSLNLIISIKDVSEELKFARVKIPSIIPRLISLDDSNSFILLEDLIQNNLHILFPGVKIKGVYCFRVIRDADIEIREQEADDLIHSVEQTLKLRRFGMAVCLEISLKIPYEIKNKLLEILNLEPEDIITTEGLIGFDVCWELTKLVLPEQTYSLYKPYCSNLLKDPENIFKFISKETILLYHPYDSFKPVEIFISSAASDKNVIGIKQTLYRVGIDSHLVESLLDAGEANKQVTIIVELRARFDENNNLICSRSLEQAGAHVSYGFPEFKTHGKMCLIVRKESDGIKTYVHIGTGNYNSSTAKIYTDLSLFTSDPCISEDVMLLFNYLTGFSKDIQFKKLLVSPMNLRSALIKKIKREIELHEKNKKGHIILKLNALVDVEIIDTLYEASQAGVKIDLIIRGVCCLRPQVSGLSENIRVISLIGRFLEHARVYYFYNNAESEVYIGSADLMTRNLNRRIEILAPIEKEEHKKYIIENLLLLSLKDNVNSWELNSTGNYTKKIPLSDEVRFCLQTYFCQHPPSLFLLNTLE